jgi:hypothetical protein
LRIASAREVKDPEVRTSHAVLGSKQHLDERCQGAESGLGPAKVPVECINWRTTKPRSLVPALETQYTGPSAYS